MGPITIALASSWCIMVTSEPEGGMAVRAKEPKRRSRKPVGERLSIGFSSETYERILDLADSKSVSVAQIVREAVADYLGRLATVKK